MESHHFLKALNHRTRWATTSSSQCELDCQSVIPIHIMLISSWLLLKSPWMQGFRLGYRPGLGQGGFLPRNVGESHGFHGDLRVVTMKKCWFYGIWMGRCQYSKQTTINPLPLIPNIPQTPCIRGFTHICDHRMGVNIIKGDGIIDELMVYIQCWYPFYRPENRWFMKCNDIDGVCFF